MSLNSDGACEANRDFRDQAGVAALQYLSKVEQVPDLVLRDLNMPKMSGHETLGLIRCLHPERAGLQR